MARDDTHPPLYFFLLRGWEDLFGDREYALRSLNLCLSLLAIVLLYFCVARTIDDSAALWAALLMACASPQITFALEVRNYMLAMVLLLAAAWAMIRLLQTPSVGRGIELGFWLLMSMLTHYYCVGVAAALVVYGTTVAPKGAARNTLLLTAVTVAAVFFLVWGPSVVHQLPNFHSQTHWLADAGPGRVARWVTRLGRTPAELIATGLPDGFAWVGLGYLLLPYLCWRRLESRLWILWLVGGVGLIAVMDLARSTLQLGVTRYLLFASPAVYVLIAMAGRGRWRWVPPSVAVVLSLLSLRSAYVPSWRVDLRTPVETIERRLQPGDGFVVSGPDPVFASIVYAAAQHYFPKMPAVSAVLTKPADTSTLQALRACPNVWVIWLWPDRGVERFAPGFVMQESGHITAFGDVIRGRVKPPALRTIPTTRPE